MVENNNGFLIEAVIHKYARRIILNAIKVFLRVEVPNNNFTAHAACLDSVFPVLITIETRQELE